MSIGDKYQYIQMHKNNRQLMDAMRDASNPGEIEDLKLYGQLYRTGREADFDAKKQERSRPLLRASTPSPAAPAAGPTPTSPAPATAGAPAGASTSTQPPTPAAPKPAQRRFEDPLADFMDISNREAVDWNKYVPDDITDQGARDNYIAGLKKEMNTFANDRIQAEGALEREAQNRELNSWNAMPWYRRAIGAKPATSAQDLMGNEAWVNRGLAENLMGGYRFGEDSPELSQFHADYGNPYYDDGRGLYRYYDNGTSKTVRAVTKDGRVVNLPRVAYQQALESGKVLPTQNRKQYEAAAARRKTQVDDITRRYINRVGTKPLMKYLPPARQQYWNSRLPK